MRVRITGAHHHPAIFEDLHMVDPIQGAELRILFCPRVYHFANRSDIHIGYREIMSRRKAHHAAYSALRSSQKQFTFIRELHRSPGDECCEIVVEDVGVLVIRVSMASCSAVARAQIAARVIGGRCTGGPGST
jgi:hypothetical protein